jgi:hypothetical protein
VCTVSVISQSDGYRVMVNRDEADTRPAASQPAWHTLLTGDGHAVRAMWPTDPVGGGTWIGVNEHGLLLTLLNYNLESAPGIPVVMTRTDLRSRGEIIPQLLSHTSGVQAVQALSRSDLSCYGPFRLVAVAPVSGSTDPIVIESRWNMDQLQVLEPIAPPACFASSGLGDSLVRVRGDLFRKLLAETTDAPHATQDAFHRHQWPHATHLSVMMSRKGVRTVSVSTVTWRNGEVGFQYSPISAEFAAHPNTA